MSQISVRQYHNSRLTRQHWLSEQMLNLTDMTVVHVCPNFFSEMLYLMNGANILQQGKIYLPHGDSYQAPITAQDIGESVAAILENPQKHDRKRFLLTGPERLSHDEIAAIASKVLGTDIEYIPTSTEDWANSMKQTGYISDFLIQHLEEVGKSCQEGAFDMVTADVEELTGHKPMGLEEFIKTNLNYFTPETLTAIAEKLTHDLQSNAS